MGAYATIADVQTAAGGEARLRQLSDVDQRGTVNVAVVQAALDRAEDVARTQVGFRYGDGGAPTPRALVGLVAAEAVFLLKVDRGMSTDVDMELHKERVDMLRDIAAGRATLGPADVRSPLVVDESSPRGTDKAVGRDNLKGYW